MDFTVNAVIANKGFTANAVIIGTRQLHDRTRDHSGTEDTTTVVLSSAIGPYAAGTTVQDVLAGLSTRLSELEQGNRRFATFRIDAFILPTFRLDAVIRRAMTGSFAIDAVVSLVGPHSFTINSVVRRSETSPAFTMDAFLV